MANRPRPSTLEPEPRIRLPDGGCSSWTAVRPLEGLRGSFPSPAEPAQASMRCCASPLPYRAASGRTPGECPETRCRARAGCEDVRLRRMYPGQSASRPASRLVRYGRARPRWSRLSEQRWSAVSDRRWLLRPAARNPTSYRRSPARQSMLRSRGLARRSAQHSRLQCHRLGTFLYGRLSVIFGESLT